MKKALALSSVSLATMLFAIDISVVNTALPAIQAAFNTSYLDLRWIIDAFSIFLVSLLIPAGILGDRVSETKLLYCSLSVFFIACVIAGFAQSFSMLLVGRALQGIGMACLFPTTLAVMTHQFATNEKTKAVAIWSSCSGIGLAIGPVLGGFILSFASWRWIFLFNLPFIVLSIILGVYTLKDQANKAKPRQIHFSSLGFFILAVAGLITAVLEEPNWGILSPMIWGLLIVSLLLFYAVYYIEKHKPEAMIDFTLFKHPIYVKSSCITFTCGLVLYSLLYLAPLYLHNVLLHRGYMLGLLMLPLSASLALSSRFVSHFTHWLGLKRLLAYALIIMIIADLMQLHFGMIRTPYYITITFILIGFSWGLAYAGSTSYSLTVIPNDAISTASSLFMTVRNFGGGLGLALSGTLFYHFRNHTLSGPLAKMTDAATLQKISFLHGFYAAVIFFAAFAFISLLILHWRGRTD